MKHITIILTSGCIVFCLAAGALTFDPRSATAPGLQPGTRSVQSGAFTSRQIQLAGQTIATTGAVGSVLGSADPAAKFDISAATMLQKPTARGTAAYIIQFSGPVRQAWKDTLSGAGVRLFRYIPENAFIVEVEQKQLQTIAEYSFVQWIGEYKPAYKLQESIVTALRTRATNGTVGQDQTKVVTLCLFLEDDVTGVREAIGQAGGEVISYASERNQGIIRARIPLSGVEQLAELGEVEWIEPYIERQLHNDVAVQPPRMNAGPIWNTYGLTGRGQVIGHADTGLDIGVNNGTLHPDFTGRVHFAVGRTRAGAWSDLDGHGTHTAGSILGSGAALTGRFRGVAWEAELAHQSIADAGGVLSGIPLDIGDLFYQTYTNDARIHSDSWGSPVYGVYNTDSRNADMFMWNQPDMLLVFSAGNDGIDANANGVVDSDSMGSPGTAKNVLTVGASETDRPAGSGGASSFTWGAGWPADYPANPIQTDLISTPDDGINQGMAAFSSRGPCNDGRVKPDIIAPGTDIISCRSQDPSAGTGWGVYNSDYIFSGGTSMSCPLTAGAAALVRQYYMDRKGEASPSAALIKATLLNGARSLTPGQYGTGGFREIPALPRPNNVEGWGQVELENSLYPTGTLRTIYYDNQALSTGQKDTYQVVLTSPSWLSVTVAWTDYPATLVAGTKLVNDLDVYVIRPDGSTNYHKGAAVPDRLNNVEGIDIPAAGLGTNTIEVHGYNVPNGPQPYALVIQGAMNIGSVTSTPPSNIDASDGGYTDRVRVQWDAVYGATGYRLFRNTVNDNASAVNISGTITGSSYDDMTAVVNTPYFYWVQAGDASGWSDYSTGDSGYSYSGGTQTVALLNETFEGAFPGTAWALSASPTWGLTTYRSVSPTHSAYCCGSSVPAPGPYPNSMNGWMITGPYDLSDAYFASLAFNIWVKCPDTDDGLFFGFSTNFPSFYGYWISGDYSASGWLQVFQQLTNVYYLGNLAGAPQV